MNGMATRVPTKKTTEQTLSQISRSLVRGFHLWLGDEPYHAVREDSRQDYWRGCVRSRQLLPSTMKGKSTRMAFNPGNGFDAPGITHARKDVYAASAENRAGRGLLSTDEARRFLMA